VGTEPKWPRRLVIVRHGESEQNAILDIKDKSLDSLLLENQKKVSDVNIPLTQKGISQAIKVGEYLAKTEKFDVCFTSPYLRTKQTAENILSCFDYKIPLYEENRLREKEFGRLHGFTTEEIIKYYPDEFINRERDGKYWYRLLGGENYPDVEERIHSFMDKMQRNYRGRSLLISTHQVPCLSIRKNYQHLSEKEVIELGNVPNCGIQEYIIDTSKHPEGRMKLVEWNKVVY
jgi:broad specificity phosphatase PhoE